MFLPNLSIAIAHEWLDSRAGSEKTFELLARAFPTADLYALTAEPGVAWNVDGRELTTSALDRGPLRRRRALTLPLMPMAWRTITRKEHDVVITSSHACAKGFWPGRAALHLSYCHTPMRYVWLPQVDRRSLWVPRPVVAALRRWDLCSTNWVNSFAANSSVTASRISEIYRRDARVIAPPVNTDFFTPALGEPSRDYLLAFSRMIPYKKLDLAIEAAGHIGRRLIVAGWGPDEARLRQIAADRAPGLVDFVIAPSDAVLRTLYRHASALVFPALEDFGIVPVEAQACGTPVIALNHGGSRDTVIHGVTGLLVEEQSAEAFAEAIEHLGAAGVGAEKCIAHGNSFSEDAFIGNVRSWMADSAAGLVDAR